MHPKRHRQRRRHHHHRLHPSRQNRHRHKNDLTARQLSPLPGCSGATNSPREAFDASSSSTHTDSNTTDPSSLSNRDDSSVPAPTPIRFACGDVSITYVAGTVGSGTISCNQATAVMNHYQTLPPTQYGDINSRDVDGWRCTTPTYGITGPRNVCHRDNIILIGNVK